MNARLLRRIKAIEQAAPASTSNIRSVVPTHVPPADPFAVAEILRQMIASDMDGAALNVAFGQLPLGAIEFFRTEEGWRRIGLTNEELLALALRLPPEEDDL